MIISYLGFFQLNPSLLYDIHCEVVCKLNVFLITPVVRGEKVDKAKLLEEGTVEDVKREKKMNSMCTRE